jgi:3-hydroxybutyryl-CoA dehydratase
MDGQEEGLGIDRKGEKIMPEEKLPEWFEKDFFLHDQEQRSWDELEVGEEYETVPFTVTAERIAKYVEGTDDHNPVFCDEEAASKTRFGGIIAPPTIVVPIVFATTPPDIWIKMPGAINPGQKLEFGVPVRPGDTIRCRARLNDKYIKRGRKYAMGRMEILNQRDEMVCVWTGGLILPR